MKKMDLPLEIAHGVGGRIELHSTYIYIWKGGILGNIFSILGYESGVMENTIVLDRVASVEIVHPMIGLSYVHLSYAGAPTRTGRWLRDSFAENGLLLSLVDNRPFYRLLRKLRLLIEQADGRSIDIKGLN